jgi:branched-chain amino acid transport system permease protein
MVGINVTQVKVLGFSLGGAVAGLSGGLFVHYSTYIDHDMVALPLAIASVTYPILGGLGSFVGPLLGTAILVSLTEGLRALHEFREFVYGTLIIVMMIFRPRGLVDEGLVQRVRGWFP